MVRSDGVIRIEVTTVSGAEGSDRRGALSAAPRENQPEARVDGGPDSDLMRPDRPPHGHRVLQVWQLSFIHPSPSLAKDLETMDQRQCAGQRPDG